MPVSTVRSAEDKAFLRESRRLKKLIQQVPAERRVIAENLVNEILFMAKTMQKLKLQVEQRGGVELFKQGKQEFLRESPALKAYNTTIQRYSLLNKQFLDMLPKQVTEATDSALYSFIKQEQ